jgi:DNA-binding NtrC family response regulator
MREIYRLIERIAPTRTVVLIVGETGTGKELIAQAIHDQSGRSGPFVAVNCAAIPRELAEAELFGSERGAFTEAVSRGGRFEQAEGGTLFLDEIGDLALAAQGILLRVLDQRKIQRLGSPRDISIDARVIAATNIDLVAASAEGRFRRDLLYRLRQIRIEPPPLRGRGEDLLALVDHLLPLVCDELRLSVRTIEPDALRALRAYSWPGNVRELKDVLLLACSKAEDAVINVGDLPAEISRPQAPMMFVAPALPPGMSLVDASQALSHAAEAQWIREALEIEKTKSGAARRLRINRRTLLEKLAAFKIDF